MRQYVESMGGKLELVAKYPDRPPVVIDHIGGDVTLNKRGSTSRRTPLPPGAGWRRLWLRWHRWWWGGYGLWPSPSDRGLNAPGQQRPVCAPVGLRAGLTMWFDVGTPRFVGTHTRPNP